MKRVVARSRSRNHSHVPRAGHRLCPNTRRSVADSAPVGSRLRPISSALTQKCPAPQASATTPRKWGLSTVRCRRAREVSSEQTGRRRTVRPGVRGVRSNVAVSTIRFETRPEVGDAGGLFELW